MYCRLNKMDWIVLNYHYYVFDVFGVVTMFQNTIELIDHEKCAFFDYNKYIARMCKEEIARFNIQKRRK